MSQTRRNFFYKKLTVGAMGSFPNTAQIIIPFSATHLIIANDSTNNGIAFSFLRPDVDGELFEKNAPITFDGINVSKIWLKKISATPNPQVRIWAWRL